MSHLVEAVKCIELSREAPDGHHTKAAKHCTL
uniref:Uncharacterized protein n=1 Tax=Anguilla anguilla TaxID=7936 RepID=A0A0E9QD76_ANGAN